MIKVNGEEYQISEIKLIDFLSEHGYLKGRYAVECNEEIIPKAMHEDYVLHDGDVVEVVSLVGGG